MFSFPTSRWEYKESLKLCFIKESKLSIVTGSISYTLFFSWKGIGASRGAFPKGTLGMMIYYLITVIYNFQILLFSER